MAIVEPLAPTADGHRRLRLRSTSNNEPIHEITVDTKEDVDYLVSALEAIATAPALMP